MMKVKTLDGPDLDLTQEMIGSLKMSLSGSVLFPGEPGYDNSRTVWNAMIDKKPALIVRKICAGT